MNKDEQDDEDERKEKEREREKMLQQTCSERNFFHKRYYDI